MRRLSHVSHVVRMAIVFLAGIIVLLIARAALTPDDFGTLGFYRAGAIDDARLQPMAYAGRAACEECHGGTYISDVEDAEALAAANPKGDNGHALLKCGACHGPLYFHQLAKEKADRGEEETGPEKPVPLVAADTLCLSCHQDVAGRPEFQPQVVVGDHGAKDPCDSCHRPHRPRTDEDE